MRKSSWSIHERVSEGVDHNQPSSLGGTDQCIISSGEGDGTLFILLGQHVLKLETTGQVNGVKAA